MSNPVMNDTVSRNFFKFLEGTIINLLALASYTSSIYNVEEFAFIKGICKADQDGEIFIEFSHDGTNFYGEVPYSYSANDPLAIDVPICAKYMRTRFVNGSVAQTSFNLILYATLL